ncbi:NAD(P)-dependent dehydrogenase, short-chain alcohol dehydrogenase family [Chitinophaga eiseniae]|uniref:NAD(P)-dependent dehydrogenase, short-chain alcohol dehydrogenase family n=1 Tax=Chitinophaga eiseniae TaxID=634771 RepID=A0A1T4KAW8_9BACT|nr:short chain dehydrogenase [Chitinophaga eiseniae]SJZ39580.1 NAD(P)-dependent dehydrogenase, short-chain alcohol dehydrogenase family [Chitinophaga eiseniae]
MKIVLIGGHGTIGKTVAAALSSRHEVIIAGRNSGDIQVDITSETSIEDMFKALKSVDACICTAGTGYYGDFGTMRGQHMTAGIQGKLMGQVNLVLIGKDYLTEGGSFTLTSGVAAEQPAKNGTCVAMINGAVNSFVLGASQELKRDQRINAVSPGLVEDSGVRYGALFPGYNLVPMHKVANAYLLSVEGAVNGRIIKVYE